MVRVVKLYAISNQPYAKYVRLTVQIFLNSLQALFIAQVLFHSLVYAAAPLAKVLVTTGSASEREGALYVAQDQGYFRKYGLDLTLVQVRNGPVGMSALSSGESLLHWGSVSAANLGAIAEGADLVFVAGFINRLTGTFAVNPAIHSPAELKGKSLGVNSLSGGTWIFTMLTLNHLGAVAWAGQNSDEGTGDNSAVSQALLAGNVDAAYLSYTYAKIVHNRGFRVLADLEKLPISFQVQGLSHDETRSRRRPGRSKTSSKLCSIAWPSFGLRKTNPRSSRAWPKDSVLNASMMPKKGIKV